MISLSRYSSLPASLNIKLFCTLLWQHSLDCNNTHVPLNRFSRIRLANSNSIYFNIVWQHFRQPIRCPHFSTWISEFINTLEYNYKLHIDFQYPFIYAFCITENLILKFPTVKFQPIRKELLQFLALNFNLLSDIENGLSSNFKLL